VDEKLVFKLHWGPQHPASGHLRFVLDVEGDLIEKVMPEIGYTHRGIEKLIENRNFLQAIPLMERLNNLDSFNLSLGLTRAVEQIIGTVPPTRARFIRTIAGELGRIMSHLYWLSIFGVVAGLFTIIMWPIADRELFLDLAEMLTGSRVTYTYFVPGGVLYDIPSGFRERAFETIEYFEKRLEDYRDFVFENKVYLVRTKDVGIVNSFDAVKFGLTGPSLRGKGGDSYSRAFVRLMEIKESLNIVRQALEMLPDGAIRNRLPFKMPKGEVYSRVESARGELGVYLVSDGKEKPYRVKISSPSFRNLSALEHFLKGIHTADLPVIYHSMDIWALDADR
jgi:NADH-quinone oxidoreductase subunit D